MAIALAAVVCSGCATWRTGSAERPVITAVEFLGNERIDDGELGQAIRTEESGWLPFSKGVRVDPDVLATDLRRIERYYRARGFYAARVEGWRLAYVAEGQARLGIIVEENKPIRVRRLEVEGIAELTDRDREFLLDGLPLSEGEVLTEPRYERTRQLLEERLGIRGYAFAEVEGAVDVFPVEGYGEVTFEVVPGERYRLGAIEVKGNEAVSDRPVLWASALETGQVYNTRRIDDAHGSIVDTGVFRAVDIDFGDPTADNRLPVIIRVREAPLQAFEVGVGGGIDESSQRARGRVTWRHRDLFGGFDLLEITARGGYAVLPTVFEPIAEGPIWGGEARFRRPNFLRRNVMLASRLDYEHDLLEAYTTDSARAAVGLETKVWEFGLSTAYGLQLYRLSQLRTAPAGAPDAPRVNPDRCPAPCTISYLEPRVWWDHRDDLIEPRRGFYAAVGFEQGGGLLGGTHEYYRMIPELRAYTTPAGLGQRVTLAARVKSGWMWPVDGASPIVRRFYSGGPDSHRGYALRRLAPMVHQIDGGFVPIGGDYLFESSAEARVWITENLIGVAFTDVGSVGFRPTTFRPDQLSWAIGPGLRYLTPIGPVRFDVGYRVYAPTRRTIDAPHDVIRENRWAFHVGLGEAF